MSGMNPAPFEPRPQSSPAASRVAPRIEAENGIAARLEAPEAASLGLATAERDPSSWGMPALVLSGFAVLAVDGRSALRSGRVVLSLIVEP